MKKLTKVQQDTLNFIKKFRDKNQYNPTYLDIAEHYGVSDTAIHNRIRLIEKKGYIEKIPGKNRGFRIKDTQHD